MTRRQIKTLLSKLRCKGCSREPTEAEIEEMIGTFGHKLGPGDSGRIVWICRSCDKNETGE